MKKLGLALLATLVFGSTLPAQELAIIETPDKPLNAVAPNERQGSLSMDRQLAVSKSIIHMKAQQRAAQRMARMEAAKWYGHSPLRPVVSSLPYLTHYNPVVPAYPYGRTWTYHYSQVPEFYSPDAIERLSR